MINVLQEQFLYCFTWSSNQLLNLNIFSFVFLEIFLLINTNSSCFDDWIFCQHSLTNWSDQLVSKFLAVSCAFLDLWMLVTMDKPCHGPHTSRMTTWITIFTRILFSVSKKWVRSWSHVFVITYHETLPRKLLAIRPEKVTTKEKRRKTRQSIATFFELNAIKKIKILLIEHAG